MTSLTRATQLRSRRASMAQPEIYLLLIIFNILD